LEFGGEVQLVYEALRAEALGETAGPTVNPSWRYRWESFGLLGLFKDQELHTAIREPIRDIFFQGDLESADGWRKTLEVYRSVIDKSFDDVFSRRGNHELTATPCGDLREGIFTSTTETVHDRESSYAVALSS
jgi:hypothetical protein